MTKEKRVTKEIKKFPGYLMAEVEFNEKTLYLFRETSGVGDFVGGHGILKPPTPMSDREVAVMLGSMGARKGPRKGRAARFRRKRSSSTSRRATRSRSAKAPSPAWKAK